MSANPEIHPIQPYLPPPSAGSRPSEQRAMRVVRKEYGICSQCHDPNIVVGIQLLGSRHVIHTCLLCLDELSRQALNTKLTEMP